VMAVGKGDEGRLRQIERLTSGAERLDEVLGGGIPRYSVVFVTGVPGTGKTILSQQAVFANARAGRKSLYLTTISEPSIKVLRFLQGFDFFDPALFGDRVIYGDLGSTLRKEGPEGLTKQVDALVRAHKPALVVIDSFKALRDTIRDQLAFREFTSDLGVRLATWEVTSLLVGEYSADDLSGGPEFAIADGIVYLYGTEEAQQQKRFLRVMKMRGAAYRAGENYFEISPRGIEVFPRMAAGAAGEYSHTEERLGSTVEGLTEMAGGGLHGATSTLISGATGSGKSLLALSFLVAAARKGQPGLLVSFEESADQITRNSATFDWDLADLRQKGLLDVYHVSPSELNIDRHAFAIRERADRIHAKMVVIDSISAFEASVPEQSKYMSYIWAINDYFKRQGVTVIMTTEAKDPFAAMEISTRAVSFVSDNIIVLRYVEVGSEIKRVVGVLKMRGSGHDRHLRELLIEPPRLAVGTVVQQAGILGETVRGR
jgi:circadian clock protein KaiC